MCTLRRREDRRDRASGVSASYGNVPAIDGVTINVGEGEAVGLLGANGAGKSTTLRAISGLVKLTSGLRSNSSASIWRRCRRTGSPSLASRTFRKAGRVFPEMTVNENLEIGSYAPRAKADRASSLDLVYSIFPRLAERRSSLPAR
jgi:branched-chain amino acid transport system ATP-binding protein